MGKDTIGCRLRHQDSLELSDSAMVSLKGNFEEHRKTEICAVTSAVTPAYLLINILILLGGFCHATASTVFICSYLSYII